MPISVMDAQDVLIGNCRCSETLEFGPSTKVQTHKVSTIIAERWIVFE